MENHGRQDDELFGGHAPMREVADARAVQTQSRVGLYTLDPELELRDFVVTLVGGEHITIQAHTVQTDAGTLVFQQIRGGSAWSVWVIADGEWSIVSSECPSRETIESSFERVDRHHKEKGFLQRSIQEAEQREAHGAATASHKSTDPGVRSGRGKLSH